MLNIDNDIQRFKDICKGRIRDELKRYVSSGELIGQQGGKPVSVPIRRLGIPRLRHGKNPQGVGQGEGGEGQAAPGQDGEPGPGQAGTDPAEHMLEVEFSVDELTDILAEELELPRIEPKGAADLDTARPKYTGIAQQGPESLRHGKRTYKQALKRHIAEGSFDPKRPRVIPLRGDRRYRAAEVEPKPHSRAVLVYMMDVSGSMGTEQKETVRTEVFWLDAWIKRHYEHVATRYIVHDAKAREVDRDTFFRTREAGGTMISSAYGLAAELIDREHPPADWNVYAFHFSDGDNGTRDDTEKSLALLRERILPAVNQFAYVQVKGPWGSGKMHDELEQGIDDEKLVLSKVHSRDAILGSLKEVLGRGR